MGTEEGTKIYPATVEEFLRDLTLDVSAVNFKGWVVALDHLPEDERRGAIRKFEEALRGHLKEADAYTNWGDALYGLKRYEEAITEYQKSSRIQPNHAVTQNNWGLALYALKHYDEAIQKYEMAVKIRPDYALPYLNWGAALSALKHYDEAIEKYEKAVKIQPDYAFAYGNWGNALFNLKRYTEAIEKYLTAVKLDSVVIPYDNWVAALDHVTKNESREAAQRFEELTKGRPKEVNAYNNWGNALFNLNRYEEAVEKYRKATEIDPAYIHGYANWGNALFNLNRYEEAIEKYRKATEIDPNSAYAYTGWGNALLNLKRYDEAIEKYRTATNIDEKFVDAYNGWGNALFGLKRYDEAIEKYRTAITIDEKFVYGYNNWGNALYALAGADRYNEAIEKYQKVIEIDPQNFAAYFGWGIVLEAMKRYDEAVEKYEAACKIDPLDPYPYHNIANLFFRRGLYKEGWARWDKTKEVYRDAQKQGTPKSRTADFYLYHGSLLHEVYRELGDAKNIYTEGLTLDPNATGILVSLVDLYLKMADESPESRTEFYWKAKEAQEKAARLLSETLKKGEDSETRLLLGKLFLKRESYDDAKTHLLEALQREKKSAELYAAAGVLYSRMEDFKGAVQYFKASLELDPDDLNVWSNLAETYLKLGMKDKAEAEYKKILRIAPDHVESRLGLGEVFLAMGGDDEDMYDRAIGCFGGALDIAREEGRGSKKLNRKEEAAALHSLAYARVMFYEKAPAISKDEKDLRQALADFRACVRLDADDHKAERSKQKLVKRLDRFSPRWLADKIAPWAVFGLSLIVFVFSQSTYYFGKPTLQKPITDAGSYALLTFGSLIFAVAGLYLPQILKLKVGGIELEKKPIEQITTSMSLGITR